MTSASVSLEFHGEFQRLKALAAAVEAGQTADAARRLLDLRQAFIALHAQLPLYDQKSYEGQIRDLEQRLEGSKAGRPKSRFAFRRAAPSRTPTPSAPTPAQPAREGGRAEASGTGREGYTIEGKEGVRLTGDDIRPAVGGAVDITLTLSGLRGCLVDLRAAPVRNLHLSALSHTLLLLPPGAGVLAHNLATCAVFGDACAQFRLHDSTALVLGLGIESFPVIEGCTSIFTMPFSEGGAGRWDAVQDFDAPSGASTNWRPLTPEEQATVRAALGRSIEAGTPEAVLAAIPS